MALLRRWAAPLAVSLALVACPLGAGAATPPPFPVGTHHITLSWSSTTTGARVRVHVGSTTLTLVMASGVLSGSLHGSALHGKYTSNLGLNNGGSIVDDFTLKGTWGHAAMRGSAAWVINGNTLAGHATLHLVIGHTTVSGHTSPSTNDNALSGVVTVRS